MPKLIRNNAVGFVAGLMLVMGSLSDGTYANEVAEAKATKNASELRVEIPIGSAEKGSTEERLKNKLLTAKMIKMGRARSQSCTRCHGRLGIQSLAHSAGWERSITEFVILQLTAFREGTRSHAIMSSIARPLSNQDIALIAAWYQSVSPGKDK